MKSNTSRGLLDMAAYLSQISRNLSSLRTDFSSLNFLIQLSIRVDRFPSFPPLGYSCSIHVMYLNKTAHIVCFIHFSSLNLRKFKNSSGLGKFVTLVTDLYQGSRGSGPSYMRSSDSYCIRSSLRAFKSLGLEIFSSLDAFRPLFSGWMFSLDNSQSGWVELIFLTY